MKNKASESVEFNQYMVAFEEWGDQTGSSDLEEFIRQRGLSENVAEELRSIDQLEKEVAKLVVEPARSIRSEITDEPLPNKIGNYCVIRKIGEGGMGVVLLAAQEKPVKRTVAIKLIRSGFETGVFLKRFESERQLLARMSHPNIAAVVDAGETGNGQPYLVMEYVDGKTITDYCNVNRVGLNARLDLYLQLCDAIRHAHQKGLLHRDIKPTNVLVTEIDGKPRVKVIDFGLAREIVTEESNPRLTQAESVLGSPLWMSPEQASGRKDDQDESVDTRSDIFSLGVILYQLLTNSTPITKEFYDKASRSEIIDAVHHHTPPYPSRRIWSAEGTKAWVTKNTGSSFANWSSMLKNDLDWVTMKALEKEPDRRYPTAAALADDVRRFVKNEPVVARPPSGIYNFRKFVKRNRFASLTAIVSAALLMIATAVSIMFAWNAIESRKIAESEKSNSELMTKAAKDAQELAESEKASSQRLLNAIIECIQAANVAEPGASYDPELTALMVSFYKKIGDFKLPDQNQERSLRSAFIKALSSNGESELVQEELRNVIALEEETFGENSNQAIHSSLLLCGEYLKAIMLDEAEKLTTECQAMLDSRSKIDPKLEQAGSLPVRVATMRAAVANNRQQYGQAKVIFEELLGKPGSSSLPPGVLAQVHGQLGQACLMTGDYSAAERNWEKGYGITEQSLGTDHHLAIKFKVCWLDAASCNDSFPETAEQIVSTIEGIRIKFGPNDTSADLVSKCLKVLLLQEKPDWVIEHGLQNYEDCLSCFGESPQYSTLTTLEQLTMAYKQNKNWSEALVTLRKAIALNEALYDEGHPTLTAKRDLEDELLAELED